MQIETIGTARTETQTVVVRGRIHGAVPRRTYVGSRTFWRPETVTVTWSRERADGGDWSAWTMHDGDTIVVAGPHVRGDCSPIDRPHFTATVAGGVAEDWALGTRPDHGRTETE